MTTISYPYGKVHFSVIHALKHLMSTKDNDIDCHMLLRRIFIRDYGQIMALINVARDTRLSDIPPEDPDGVLGYNQLQEQFCLA